MAMHNLDNAKHNQAATNHFFVRKLQQIRKRKAFRAIIQIIQFWHVHVASRCQLLNKSIYKQLLSARVHIVTFMLMRWGQPHPHQNVKPQSIALTLLHSACAPGP
eukprot:1151426-Pelagomonas_calceolata.AAC.12